MIVDVDYVFDELVIILGVGLVGVCSDLFCGFVLCVMVVEWDFFVRVMFGEFCIGVLSGVLLDVVVCVVDVLIVIV